MSNSTTVDVLKALSEVLENFEWLVGVVVGAVLAYYFSNRSKRKEWLRQDAETLIDIVVEHEAYLPYEQILQPKRTKGLASGLLHDAARYGPGRSPRERINAIIEHGAFSSRQRSRIRALVAKYFHAVEQLTDVATNGADSQIDADKATEQWAEWTNAYIETVAAFRNIRFHLRSLKR